MNYTIIRILRNQMQLTQEQLAEKSGVSLKMIQLYERGYEGTPRKKTLEQLGRVLSPNDLEAFWAALRDPPDYATANKRLEDIMHLLPPGMIHPLRKLLDPESEDPVPMFMTYITCEWRTCCSAAFLHEHSYILMDVFAAAAHHLSLTDHPDELEHFTASLMCCLRELLACCALPGDIADRLRAAIAELVDSRMQNVPEARIHAIRSAFFCLYDTWDIFSAKPTAYYALDAIFLLCGCTDNSSGMRLRLFRAYYRYCREVEYYQHLNA